MTAETPPKRPLFRPEAVEHHARAKVGNRTLDLRERRVAWLFRGLLVALAAAVALAFTIRTETQARGPAVVDRDGRRATVFVARTDRLADARTVTLDVGGTEVTGRITGVGGPAEVLVTLDVPAPAGARGSAVIPLGRKSVAALLLGRG
ncbi:MAG TPA: hypothetical protein VNA20_03050 [Frankiaceae bacterium]|nr:hypothetical protein [Frankiaceae bacterium]